MFVRLKTYTHFINLTHPSHINGHYSHKLPQNQNHTKSLQLQHYCTCLWQNASNPIDLFQDKALITEAIVTPSLSIPKASLILH